MLVTLLFGVLAVSAALDMSLEPPYVAVESGGGASFICRAEDGDHPSIYWVRTEDNRPLFHSTPWATVDTKSNASYSESRITLLNVTRTQHVDCVAVYRLNGSLALSSSRTPSTAAVPGITASPQLRRPQIAPRLQLASDPAPARPIQCSFPDPAEIRWWTNGRDTPLNGDQTGMTTEPGGQGKSVLRVTKSPVAQLLVYCSADRDGVRAYSEVAAILTVDFPEPGPLLSPLAIGLIAALAFLIIVAIAVALLVRRRRHRCTHRL